MIQQFQLNWTWKVSLPLSVTWSSFALDWSEEAWVREAMWILEIVYKGLKKKKKKWPEKDSEELVQPLIRAENINAQKQLKKWRFQDEG